MNLYDIHHQRQGAGWGEARRVVLPPSFHPGSGKATRLMPGYYPIQALSLSLSLSLFFFLSCTYSLGHRFVYSLSLLLRVYRSIHEVASATNSKGKEARGKAWPEHIDTLLPIPSSLV
jgi:hypothetical protein